MQEVEYSRPVLLEELWSNRPPRAAGHKHLRKHQRGKKAKGPTWLSRVPAPLSLALSHFSYALQLAHSASATLVQREAYRWLSLLLSPYHPLLSSHCLLLSSQLSLSLQAALALRRKICKHARPDPSQHPFQDVLITLQDASQPCPKSYEGLNCLLTARQLLLPPSSPPPLSFTLSLLSGLPEGSQFTTLSLAPSLNKGGMANSDHTSSRQDHLIISTVGNGREPLLVKVPIKAGEVLAEFYDILQLSEQSLCLNEKRAWWAARMKLDTRMKDLVTLMQSDWLGEWTHLSPPPSSSSCPAHFLCPDRILQQLPWESTAVLSGQPVGRIPSLLFIIAQQMLQSHHHHFPSVVDHSSGYFVLNPRGDLPNTEKRFCRWFREELGWRGVASHAPSSQEYSEGLEKHELFVYCGHGSGQMYLSPGEFQLLCCRATTLLMGCCSGRLAVGGACDPSGPVLSYLLAGCPSVVAVLWDVTDADIDRLSKALLQDWMEGEGKGEGRFLPVSLSSAKTVCKLQGMNGYAAVVYGNPCMVTRR